MTRERREHDYYPTDPYATESLRVWLQANMPHVLKKSWEDPCAGYGGLLEGLRIPIENRYAIEIQPRLSSELRRRVVPQNVRIGDGLAMAWTADHVVMNPPFTNDKMTAFVSRAVARQERRLGGLVIALALATWWHSDALRSRGDGIRRPQYILVPDKRVSCDGTGRGDMRAIDWLVWLPQGGRTEVVWLGPAAPSKALLEEHKRLASVGA